MSTDYRIADLARILAKLGVVSGDTVYCHSNIGLFGRAEGVSSAAQLCEAFFDAIMLAVGPRGTLIVPTYTYSFPRKELFDVEGTASKMGIFAEWVRRHPDAKRSADPSYSIAALGARAVFFTDEAPNNSFCREAGFGRFADRDGLVLNFNFPGCALTHFIERELGVPYRFDKSFTGQRRAGGQTVEVENTIYVCYGGDELLSHDPAPFVAEAKAQGFLGAARLGRGEVTAIRARNIRRIIAETLPARPWFLTKADGAGKIPVLDKSFT
jgi:aminoglycoside 3-N-acetyltransferase